VLVSCVIVLGTRVAQNNFKAKLFKLESGAVLGNVGIDPSSISTTIDNTYSLPIVQVKSLYA